MNNKLAHIAQRFQLTNLTTTPFEPELECRRDTRYDACVPRIYLLHEEGSRVEQVNEGSTVRQTLQKMGDDAKEVFYVLNFQLEEISRVPKDFVA